MTNVDIYCPICGEPTEELHEGYCADCCAEMQRGLDLHNAGFDIWEAMTDAERNYSIAKAVEEGK